MTVRAVTRLVEPHGLVISDPAPDSDHEQYDRVRDELAVDDPYTTEWEPPMPHGLVKAPPDVAASFAATPASLLSTGRPDPATPGLPPARGSAGASPESTSAPALPGGSA